MGKYKIAFIVAGSVAATVLFMLAAHTAEDKYFKHDEHHKDKKSESHEKHGDKARSVASSTMSSVYTNACGGCHWAYIPELLPSKSWEIILSTLNSHFGNDVVLTDQQRGELSTYLIANAADKSSSKIGKKITQCLAGASPIRISEVPCIVRKHRKIDQATFARKSVNGLSNCIACHPSAANSRFDDDSVTIPSE